MQNSIRKAPQRRLFFALATLLAGITMTVVQVAGASAAASSCAPGTAKPFAQFGDNANYFPMPGGDFEAGLGGWTATGGTKTVSGNETFLVRSKTDKTSLQVPVGGAVTSSWVCLTKDDPTIRFFTRSSAAGSGGNYSSMNVSIVLKGSTGSQTSVYLGQLTPSGFSSWKPSPIYSYAVWLNQSWLYGSANTVSAQLMFTVQGTGGIWNIDDAYIDPFKLT